MDETVFMFAHLFPQLRCVKDYTGLCRLGSKLFNKLGATVTEIDISTESIISDPFFEDADVIYLLVKFFLPYGSAP